MRRTLSRLNRTYPGKQKLAPLFWISLMNRKIFWMPSNLTTNGRTADVSNPDQVYDLANKLKSAGMFLMTEVEQFTEAFIARTNPMRHLPISVSLRCNAGNIVTRQP